MPSRFEFGSIALRSRVAGSMWMITSETSGKLDLQFALDLPARRVRLDDAHLGRDLAGAGPARRRRARRASGPGGRDAAGRASEPAIAATLAGSSMAASISTGTLSRNTSQAAWPMSATSSSVATPSAQARPARAGDERGDDGDRRIEVGLGVAGVGVQERAAELVRLPVLVAGDEQVHRHRRQHDREPAHADVRARAGGRAARARPRSPNSNRPTTISTPMPSAARISIFCRP